VSTLTPLGRSVGDRRGPYPFPVTDVEIRQIRFGAPVARMLVAQAQADLAARYGSGDANPVEAIEFDPPEGCFLVAWRDGEPVACAGWRTLSHFVDTDAGSSAFADDVAEIKRMYATPSVRGTGVAAALLTALEDSARAQGMRRLILETGMLQPEAIRFYEKSGYQRITNYGYYKDEPDCVSFGRDL
jgi:GNAT superfamily N-acetyltransferase